MNEYDLRSECLINYLLELVGDKWSLLIIRDILLNAKSSYGEFLTSDEKIATNILANRLTALVEAGLISKRRNPDNRTKYIYTPTERGLDLIPMFIEMVLWSVKHSPLPVPENRKMIVEQAKHDKESLIMELREHFLKEQRNIKLQPVS